MDDDTRTDAWRLDPEARTAMRLDRVRQFMARGDLATAIVEAEELLDEEPDEAECLFLLGECLLELGDASVALEAYERCVELTGGDSSSLLGLAIARFDCCDLLGCVEAARECVRLDPSIAEAHWYLGLSQERLPGGAVHAVQAFTAAHQLDPESCPYPLQIDEPGWSEAVRAALAASHPEIGRFWEGVPIVLDDLPDLQALRAHVPPVPPTVSGLFDGDPPGEDDDSADARPQGLRLFKRNLARCGDREELVERIILVLRTEALEWLGMYDEDDLDGDVDEEIEGIEHDA